MVSQFCGNMLSCIFYHQGQQRQTNHHPQLQVALLRLRKRSQLGGARRSREVKAFRARSATRATSISMSCEITWCVTPGRSRSCAPTVACSLPRDTVSRATHTSTARTNPTTANTATPSSSNHTASCAMCGRFTRAKSHTSVASVACSLSRRRIWNIIATSILESVHMPVLNAIERFRDRAAYASTSICIRSRKSTSVTCAIRLSDCHVL